MAPADPDVITDSGVLALQRGDWRAARAAFERALASTRSNVKAWLGLAYACRALRDATATADAIEHVLQLEPKNVRALIMKGDTLVEKGERISASAFYLTAVRVAPPPQELPADLRAEVARAQKICERDAAEFDRALRDRTLGGTHVDDPAARRFVQSLDILGGRRQIYVQQPRHYYFPELPQIQFYDRAPFPWLEALEAHTAAIRDELVAMLRDDTAFAPYIEPEPGRPYNDVQGLLNNPAWSACYLWKKGALVEKNAARCPKTMAALEHVPMPVIGNRCPSVLFSLLRPAAHIPPHNGLANTRLICHLPLIVPKGCLFRVGNETREWVEGKAWLFDDTIEHEAWNPSAETRVILLFDVWRPELTAHEQTLVTRMFAAIDAHTGDKPAWEI